MKLIFYLKIRLNNYKYAWHTKFHVYQYIALLTRAILFRLYTLKNIKTKITSFFQILTLRKTLTTAVIATL